MKSIYLCCLLSFLLVACASNPPSQVNNICAIFAEKKDWYPAAKTAEQRWGVPVPVLLSFIRYESGFRADARPARTKILWLIPGPRPSTAYGYPQALDGTWSDYRKATGKRWAERDDFADAVDFIGWYNATSQRRLGIHQEDAYRLYLAYYSGHGGYARGNHQNNKTLQNTARRVADRALAYQTQMQSCFPE
jgi:hypothetical protein